MAPFFNWMDIVKDLEPGPTLPAGMSRRGIVLGDVMLALHEAVPRLKGTPHRHPSAQITYMLKGKMRFSVDGEERVLSPGRVWPMSRRMLCTGSNPSTKTCWPSISFRPPGRTSSIG